MAMSTVLTPIPGHVPEALVFDFDLYNPPGAATDYHGAFARLHDNGIPDIFWTPRNGGHWIATRGTHITEIFQDHSRFSSRMKSVPKEHNPKDPLRPITLDPPEHGKYRALIQPFFTVPAIRRLEPIIRNLAINLIDGLKPNGQCEFVADFAQHLPIGIFMGMVNLPESDRLPLLNLVDEIINPGERSKQEIFASLNEYVGEKVRSRRGGTGTDLITHVANSVIDGELISYTDAVSVCSLVLIGGLDTVASTLGFIAHFLATHPTHRQELAAKPQLIDAAINEFLRRFAVTNPGRVVTRDIDYHGVNMRAGDMVMLPTFLHGLDEREFDDPLSVKFDRAPKVNAAFGRGDHTCPGLTLAKLEIRVFLEEWLARIPIFSLKAGSDVGIRAGINGSFYRLSLAWPS
ncbi:MAG: cytochrome P450 [Acidocella sp.]|nr:cytochrome P450 [Acidocella sp.]